MQAISSAATNRATRMWFFRIKRTQLTDLKLPLTSARMVHLRLLFTAVESSYFWCSLIKYSTSSVKIIMYVNASLYKVEIVPSMSKELEPRLQNISNWEYKLTRRLNFECLRITYFNLF